MKTTFYLLGIVLTLILSKSLQAQSNIRSYSYNRITYDCSPDKGTISAISSISINDGLEKIQLKLDQSIINTTIYEKFYVSNYEIFRVFTHEHNADDLVILLDYQRDRVTITGLTCAFILHNN